MESEKKVTGASHGRVIRINPSEIGAWEYCRIKWYFENSSKNADRTEKEGGTEK